MYSAEVLSQLRTLNWLSQEARRLPFDSAERQILCVQIEALRARLPLSMLRHHDDRAKRNLPSIAHIEEANCGYCRSPLPEGTLHALVHPGRFGVCPNCGVFLWSAEIREASWAEPEPTPPEPTPAEPAPVEPAPRRSARRTASAIRARIESVDTAEVPAPSESQTNGATDVKSDGARNPAGSDARA